MTVVFGPTVPSQAGLGLKLMMSVLINYEGKVKNWIEACGRCKLTACTCMWTFGKPSLAFIIMS